MVWVCPPHTSMNLNSSLPASSVMDFTNARAAAGSRNSSTNLIALQPFQSGDFRRIERFDFIDVVGTHFLYLVERQCRLTLVDLRHRETDVYQHPVTDLQDVVGQQAHADVSPDAVDVDLGEGLFGVDDVDHLPRYPKTHLQSPLSRYAAAGRRRAGRRSGYRRTTYEARRFRAVRERSLPRSRHRRHADVRAVRRSPRRPRRPERWRRTCPRSPRTAGRYRACRRRRAPAASPAACPR